MILNLENEDKERLKRLNYDKSVVFALKKLFINVCMEKPASNEALEKITKAFHDLENITLDSQTGVRNENLV